MPRHDTPEGITWIILKDSDLGRRLASFSPADRTALRLDFEREHGITFYVKRHNGDSDDQPGAWLAVPRFEILFHVPRARFLDALEQLESLIESRSESK